MNNNKPVSVDALVTKAQSLVDVFEFDAAMKFCKRAAKQAPKDARVMELMGVIAMETGNDDRALACFRKVVEVAPSASAYFYLGQMHQGHESIEFIRSGIDILNQQQSALQNGQDVDEDDLEEIKAIRRKLSCAYGSIAEIFMTDCCFDEDAEDKCFEALQQALNSDPTNPSAYVQLASFRLSQRNRSDANAAMSSAMRQWIPLEILAKFAAILLNGDVDGQSMTELQPVPSYPERLAAVKVLIELRLYELAVWILSELQQEDDEVVETWSLLGMCYWCMGCDKVVKTVLQVQLTSGSMDEEDEQRQQHVESYVQQVLEETAPLDAAVAEDWALAKDCLDDAWKLIERGMSQVDDPQALEEMQQLTATLDALLQHAPAIDAMDQEDVDMDDEAWQDVDR